MQVKKEFAFSRKRLFLSLKSATFRKMIEDAILNNSLILIVNYSKLIYVRFINVCLLGMGLYLKTILHLS
jgi:hypothetical protein